MNKLKLLAAAASLALLTHSVEASWSVQTIMPAGATYSAVTLVEKDHVFASASYLLDGPYYFYTKAFGYRYSDQSTLDFHPANAGQSSSYVRARNGVDLVGEVGSAGVWRGGQADAFERLHPAGYSISTIRAAGNGMLGGSVQRQIGLGLSWEQAGLWNAETGAFVNVHPEGRVASRILAFSGTLAGGYVDDSPYIYRAAVWTSADPASMKLYHQANDEHSMITSGFAGQFGGWFGPTVDFQYASLWDAATGARTVLHPSGFERSEINGMAGGIQVGRVKVNSYTSQAAVWRGTAGSMEVLDLPAGYFNGDATSVWTDGTTTRVGGYAYNPMGKFEAVVWTQVVPEPATFAGIAAGLAFLVRRRRR